jgi:hypothetical protein
MSTQMSLAVDAGLRGGVPKELYERYMCYLCSATTAFTDNLLSADPVDRAKNFEHVYVSIATFCLRGVGDLRKDRVLDRLWAMCSTIGRVSVSKYQPGGLPGYVVYVLLLLRHSHAEVIGVHWQTMIEECVRLSPNQVRVILYSLHHKLHGKSYYKDSQGLVFVPNTGMTPTSADSLKDVVCMIERMFAHDREMMRTCKGLKYLVENL